MAQKQADDGIASGELQRYYDRNTDLFLRLGSGGASHAIHRGLWAPGIHSGSEAAEYVNSLIADRLRSGLSRAPRVVLDLGCGVGGTMFSLARAFPDARLFGVTISPRQVAIARDLARKQGLDTRCSFVTGDFDALSLDLRADAIIAVESFVHASRPERFLATCRERLGPGGVVVIIDDFLAHAIPGGGHAIRRTIDRFREHWHVPGLCSLEALDSASGTAGLVRTDSQDLSALIRTERLRDYLVAFVSPWVRLFGLAKRPFWANVVGGHALNRAIRKGWIQYHMLTLVQRDPNT